MDELNALIGAGDWAGASSVAASLGVDGDFVAKYEFLALAQPTLQETRLLLDAIADDEWVAAAALQTARKAQVPAIAHVALKRGRLATDALAQASPSLLLFATAELVAPHQLADLCTHDQSARKLCLLRRALLDLDDKRRTWLDIWGGGEQDSASDSGSDDDDADGDEEPAEDDPWADGERADDVEARGDDWDDLEPPPAPPSHPSHPSFSTFIRQTLLETAVALAASAELDSLKALCLRHADALWPYRLSITEAIPEWIEPTRYLELLPRVGSDGRELPWENKPWRATPDWVEQLPPKETPKSGKPDPLSSNELMSYYADRIQTLSTLGLVAVSLALVQHCASRGVPGLDALGEELSLLSKLVYERPSLPPIASTSRRPSSADPEDLTIDYWRSLTPPQVLRAYLAHSTSHTLPSDIRRLVLPYLSVLESRLERAGTPDPELSNRLLYEYVLELASTNQLDHLVAIIDASKPTLPRGERLIKSDEDLARLALASLYGSTDSSTDALISMGKIFECLPAFTETETSGTEGEPPATLFHSPGHPVGATTPTALFATLQSFTPLSLSLSLDALDIHLADAEILSRYSAPVPLSWFLATHDDPKAQRAWATRMARTSATGGGGRAGDEAEFESEDEWEALMEDMVALTEKGEPDGISKAFSRLERDDVLRIFFGGLLAAGKFGLAKSLFAPSSGVRPLDPSVEEELVIAASREFYDNAETGNLHKGEMKLAFECLSAAPQTPTIKKERDFIEATSRLCSFKIYSHPGIPVAPIEIRLSKDRLDFVAKLLASNDDAYRHPDVILDLVAKLGYRNDQLAEIRALAMIAGSGLQSGDFSRAADVCDRMVDAVELLRKAYARDPAGGAGVVSEAAEVAWQNCFQLGKEDEFDDLERRMRLLGQALILCPGNRIASLLPVWTKLEDRLAMQSAYARGSVAPGSMTTESVLSGGYPYRASPPLPMVLETTGAAARTLRSAASYFPFVGGSGERRSSVVGERRASVVDRRSSVVDWPEGPRGGGYEGSREGGDGLRAGISSRLTAGVGWLIGADGALDG